MSTMNMDGDGRLAEQPPAPRPDGSPSAAISRAIVQLMARYSGRGPTKARATVAADHVAVVLEEALTPAERSLVNAGERDLVRRQREALQHLMRDEAATAVEVATGRRVRLVLCDIEPEEGVALQFFLLDPPADDA
jgi:uncharacterized protein YbcI